MFVAFGDWLNRAPLLVIFLTPCAGLLASAWPQGPMLELQASLHASPPQIYDRFSGPPPR